MQGVVFIDSVGKIRRRRVLLIEASIDDQFRHSLISQIRKEVAMISMFIPELDLVDFEAQLTRIERSLAPKLVPVKSINGTLYLA